MKPTKIFRFRYLLTTGLSLELKTNSPLIGKAVKEFLFTKTLRRLNYPAIKLACMWNEQGKRFEIVKRDGKKAFAKNPLALLPVIDDEARWGILTHLPKDFFPIHSSGIVRKSEAILFLGESGAGKSNVLFEFVRKNYAGLSDELNFLDLGTFRIHAFCRSWIFKAPLGVPLGRKKITKLLISRKFGKIRTKPLLHYYWPGATFGKRALQKSFPLKTIFSLKSRNAKKPRSRPLSSVEIIRELADNMYVFSFRKVFKSHFAARYNRLFMKLVRQFPRFERKLGVYELKITRRTRFSDLIAKNKLM